ncbi:uncharacterized protein KY384_001875 [Bacidia gigantensis]|uniref:uncharacterized protein n=1 Tax=Bacidia gigantensis TaxID=2732470 RepID=UPI001D04B90B|nr:uncharacterized protein KY384_001875 [Bacidia gigantensis]KAG8533092.1 hypothetical protein KY384_001875 [Bacidia gigantensis]
MQSGDNTGEQWLLLLPRPPPDVSFHTLKVAYRPSLTAALKDASKVTKRANACTVLEVGVAFDVRMITKYFVMQTFFSLMYKLSCVVSSGLQIDLQYDNDVDVRFFLFADSSCQDVQAEKTSLFNLVELKALAEYQKAWTTLCSEESESGEGLLQSFLHYRSHANFQTLPPLQVLRVPAGLSLRIESSPSQVSLDSPEQVTGVGPQHRSVAVGGTFDHLHAGHKLLLTMTALALFPVLNQEDTHDFRLTVGITGDDLLKNKKHREQLESWEQRQSSVSTFLLNFLQISLPGVALNTKGKQAAIKSEAKGMMDELSLGLRINYAEILDPFGPTVEDPNISALVVSAETRAGGEAVNKKREEKGWAALEVFEVDVLDMEETEAPPGSEVRSEDFQAKLSSTEIRSRISHRKAKATPAQH